MIKACLIRFNLLEGLLGVEFGICDILQRQPLDLQLFLLGFYLQAESRLLGLVFLVFLQRDFLEVLIRDRLLRYIQLPFQFREFRFIVLDRLLQICFVFLPFVRRHTLHLVQLRFDVILKHRELLLQILDFYYLGGEFILCLFQRCFCSDHGLALLVVGRLPGVGDAHTALVLVVVVIDDEGGLRTGLAEHRHGCHGRHERPLLQVEGLLIFF